MLNHLIHKQKPWLLNSSVKTMKKIRLQLAKNRYVPGIYQICYPSSIGPWKCSMCDTEIFLFNHFEIAWTGRMNLKKNVLKQNIWEVSRKVHKSQISSDTFSHLDLFWPQQRNTTNVKPLIYVCNVRGKPREITFYGQQLYLQDTAFSVPCALHILFYDTLNVAPNRCWIIQIGFGFLSFQDNHTGQCRAKMFR